MKRRRNYYLVLMMAVIATAGALHLAGGAAARFGVPVMLVVCAILAVAGELSSRRKSRSDPSPSKTEVSFPRVSSRQASSEVEPVDPGAVLGRAHRKEKWASTESEVDALLDSAIKLISSKINAHTVAIFFPTLDGGLALRRCESRSAFINRDAIIYPGVGVIGSFLKEGLRRLNLKEIVSDSMTLYYYTQDAGIRSLMASPMVAAGVERGTIIVDSTAPNNFTEDDHAFLGAAAALIGTAVFSRYMYTEHELQHGRLAAMSSIEKEFFRNLSRQSIVSKIVEIIPFALPCDRLTVSMKNDNGTATIIAANGRAAEGLLKKDFFLNDKSLASVLYANNLVLSRNYSTDHYEIRYCSDEPCDGELASFVAVPLGVDECKGMILVESTRADAYDDSYRELLGRLSTSAGLAIEKMLIFEQANALATHDGLTGLYNHRTFQQMLADEITRAIRYNEPVALVICDIDFFKKANDTWGHPFGDTVLRGVSKILESSIRQDIDTVARYGGEEFALILVKTDDTGAAETAERIRAAIAAASYRAPSGDEVRVTMSFGIAEYRKHARHINELIAKADKALYRAKENGRNRVEIS